MQHKYYFNTRTGATWEIVETTPTHAFCKLIWCDDKWRHRIEIGHVMKFEIKSLVDTEHWILTNDLKTVRTLFKKEN